MDTTFSSVTAKKSWEDRKKIRRISNRFFEKSAKAGYVAAAVAWAEECALYANEGNEEERNFNLDKVDRRIAQFEREQIESPLPWEKPTGYCSQK